MDITLQGRDLFGYLRMIPGAIDTQESTTNENALGAIRINGGATDSKFHRGRSDRLDTGNKAR